MKNIQSSSLYIQTLIFYLDIALPRVTQRGIINAIDGFYYYPFVHSVVIIAWSEGKKDNGEHFMSDNGGQSYCSISFYIVSEPIFVENFIRLICTDLLIFVDNYILIK